MKLKFQILLSLFLPLLLISCQSSSNEGDDFFAREKYEDSNLAHERKVIL
jgi:hypothetical protein